jgi:Flp pilus assembly protein TadB
MRNTIILVALGIGLVAVFVEWYASWLSLQEVAIILSIAAAIYLLDWQHRRVKARRRGE